MFNLKKNSLILALTCVNQNVAYGVYFYENKLESNNSFGRSNGICVRLVRNKK